MTQSHLHCLGLGSAAVGSACERDMAPSVLPWQEWHCAFWLVCPVGSEILVIVRGHRDSAAPG